MKIREFGNKENPIMLLISGMQAPWQIWTKHIDYFQNDYYILVPALNGHEEERRTEYYSLEKETKEIEKYFIDHHVNEIDVAIGFSMGGAIVFKLWENEVVKINRVIMDGAPLVPSGKLITHIVIRQYLSVTHKSQQRNPKTLKNFSKYFLPKQYLINYLNIADNMSDTSISNMVKSSANNTIKNTKVSTGSELIYMYGTKVNNYIAKKSAKKLKKCYPDTSLIVFNGKAHCHTLLFEPDQWINTIRNVL